VDETGAQTVVFRGRPALVLGMRQCLRLRLKKIPDL
jgi:hypothetical protein